MDRVLKTILAIILVAVLFGGLTAACSKNPAPAPTPAPAPKPAPVPTQGFQAGNLAPDFQLADMDGQSVSLSDFRGKTILLNFWASWCGPCRAEMPFIQEVFEDKRWSDNGLVILAINLGEDPATVKRFMQNNEISFPVLLDIKQNVALEYNIRNIPASFFIDKDGIIRDKVVGAFPSKAEIEGRLGNLVQ